MNAPKIGDRVRVEFEGTVTHAPNPWGMHRIDLDNGRLAHSRFTWAAPEHCTVIPPPVKVGDLVTAQNVMQLGKWSVVASVEPDTDPTPRTLHVIHHAREGITERRWFYHGSLTGDFDSEVLGFEILRVGGGAS